MNLGVDLLFLNLKIHIFAVYISTINDISSRTGNKWRYFAFLIEIEIQVQILYFASIVFLALKLIFITEYYVRLRYTLSRALNQQSLPCDTADTGLKYSKHTYIRLGL